MTRSTVPYSEELALAICERLSEGESLKNILADEGMPARSTVYLWLAGTPAFLVMYQAAREEHADHEFDRLEELMKEEPPKDDKGRVDHGWVLRQKLIINTLQWKLARMAPKKYSERLELTGAEGTPLRTGDETTPQRILEGARRLAFLLHRADAMMREKPPAPLLLPHEVK